jgi:RNA recognition motif-containing protein
MNIFVGNMSYDTTEDELRQAFQAHGEVTSAAIIMDRATGRSKGFGFVEMGSPAEAQASIRGMNGQSLEGRAIVVNEARPKEAGAGGGFGGGGRSSGGANGGYGGGRRSSY